MGYVLIAFALLYYGISVVLLAQIAGYLKKGLE